LTRKSPLGSKDFELNIPRDEVIFKDVQHFGRWEADEVSFLTKALNKSLGRVERKKIFLDIGANTGLISRQVLLKSKIETHAILVEPIPAHIEAINFNLRDLANHLHIDVHEVALGSRNATATIFTEGRNQGNSSLVRSVVPESDFQSTEIQVIDIDEFTRANLAGSEKIILKSDTQGFDASILARLSPDIWERVEAAVVEIWAIPEISADDVSQCLKNWADFTFVSWTGRGKGKVTRDEISSFWLQKNSDTRNLFLRK
jgi:FkbM family methyltransferase